MQQDAHELIRLLIDALEGSMRISKINPGLVSGLYEGELANQVRAFIVWPIIINTVGGTFGIALANQVGSALCVCTITAAL